MSQDKIAEHIAKFNVPNGEFYWVSNWDGGVESYKEDCSVSMLSLKTGPNEYTCVDGEKYDWEYVLKHELKQEKGEIMKSIELSEEKLKHQFEWAKRELVKCSLSKLERNVIAIINNLMTYTFSELKNAKPIEPIEQKWSEDEIRDSLCSLEFEQSDLDKDDGYIELVIADLKTPKPVMRDMTNSEVVDWFKKFTYYAEFEFSSDGNMGVYQNAIQFVLFPESKTNTYRVNSHSEWLPIPQIEKEK